MASHTTHSHESDVGESQATQLTSPTALRKLVLNYLVHHCYTDTAQAFAHDGISSSSTQVKTEDDEASSSMAQGSTSNGQRKAASTSFQHTSSNHVASTSSSYAPQTRSSSRLAGQQAAHQAHPLSAPPLSREDSGMEIEVDSLLSLAGAREENGSSSAASNGRHIKKEDDEEEREGEDTWMEQAAEQELDSDELSIGELRLVRVRKEIKEHILDGRIRQAIDLCNAQFPTVLNSDPTSPNVWDAEQGRAVRSVVKEREPGSNGTNNDSPRVLPANPTSLYAAHLSLNLQIQAFIESVRTASNSVSSSSSNGAAMNVHGGGMSTPAHSVAASAPGIASAAAAAASVVSRSASPAPSSTSSTGSIASANGMSDSNHSNGSTAVINPVLHAALSHAQMLFANVQKLPGYWRAMYLKELESVTALLAYTDLESSPLRKYLDQSRRIALAEQINSAIMFRAGKPSQPLIESAVRQTSFLWSTLSSEKIVVPTDHPIFTSGTVVGLDKFESHSSGGNNTTSGTSATTSLADRTKVKGKVLPSWNLHSFLLER